MAPTPVLARSDDGAVDRLNSGAPRATGRQGFEEVLKNPGIAPARIQRHTCVLLAERLGQIALRRAGSRGPRNAFERLAFVGRWAASTPKRQERREQCQRVVGEQVSGHGWLPIPSLEA
jgi:hypothetical protein